MDTLTPDTSELGADVTANETETETVEIDGAAAGGVVDATMGTTADEVAVKKAVAPRRASTLDQANGLILVAEPNKPDRSFSMGQLPANVQGYAALFGVWMMLRQAEDMDAAFAKLTNGELPAPRKAGTGGTSEVNPWRAAIAEELVHLAAKHKQPLTPEQAMQKALALTREQVQAAKTDPAVVHRHQQLTKSTSVLEGFLTAA